MLSSQVFSHDYKRCISLRIAVRGQRSRRPGTHFTKTAATGLSAERVIWKYVLNGTGLRARISPLVLLREVFSHLTPIPNGFFLPLIFNNVEVTDEFDIAQLFNNFFTGIATELETNIPDSNIDPLSLVSRVDASVFLYPVSVEECTNVISKLKNTKTGFNQLPVKFYKSLKNNLS